MLTPDEFDTFLRRLWSDQGYPLQQGERMGVAPSEIVRASRERIADLEPSVFGTWIAVLDELQSWLISLLTVTYGERRGHTKERLGDFHKAIVMLTSKVIGDNFAIRNLALAGFDTASQPILRSTCEYLEVLVAIIDDPTLAADFVASDTPESSKRFWEQHLRGGRIRKRIKRAWADYFGNETDASLFFADWGHKDMLMMSGLSHPSLAGGLFTAIAMKTKHTDENWLAVFGDRSEGTANSIYTYCKYIFPLLLLSTEFPFGDHWNFTPPVEYDESNEFHRHIKVGRNILASTILSLGSDSNKVLMFPEYDLSIFEADDDHVAEGK